MCAYFVVIEALRIFYAGIVALNELAPKKLEQFRQFRLDIRSKSLNPESVQISYQNLTQLNALK